MGGLIEDAVCFRCGGPAKGGYARSSSPIHWVARRRPSWWPHEEPLAWRPNKESSSGWLVTLRAVRLPGHRCERCQVAWFEYKPPHPRSLHLLARFPSLRRRDEEAARRTSSRDPGLTLLPRQPKAVCIRCGGQPENGSVECRKPVVWGKRARGLTAPRDDMALIRDRRSTGGWAQAQRCTRCHVIWFDY